MRKSPLEKLGWVLTYEGTATPGLKQDADGIYETDQRIFEQYALFGLINRHVADFMTDDEVSHALRNVRRTIELPFDPLRVGVHNDGHDPPNF
jgi:hypothetical protein